MKKSIALLAFAACAPWASAHAQSLADRPELSPGDSWSYQRVDLVSKQVASKYTLTIDAKRPNDYAIRIDLEGAAWAPILPTTMTQNLGMVTNINGRESDNNLVGFPLMAGKTWSAKALWINPAGRTGWDDISYSVVGVETVTVPAGTFETTKVRGEGWWNNEISRNSGKIELTYWYAPKVKQLVRYERKNWLGSGIDAYWANELTAFKVSKEGAAGAK